MKLRIPLALTLFLAIGPLTQAHADNAIAKFASGPGTILYVATGTLASLIEDGPDSKEHAARTVDAVITTGLLTEVLKATVREKRPRSDSQTSFPSGHTSVAFAVATMESHYHPKQSLLWYGGAALIGASRVSLHEHYWHDVAAGAALGYLTAKWELHTKHGLILQPIIRHLESSDSHNASSIGIGISEAF
jgi:membrane-associated phospholipid phosphatase